jgi:hypothetical protein
MKNFTSPLFICLLASIVFLGFGCGSGTDNSAVEADSVFVDTLQTVDSAQEPIRIVLIPGALEIGIPKELKVKSHKKGATEDSLFFEVEMGVNPMDLEFDMLKFTDDSMSLEQMERQALYISDEGKTYEHESGKKYLSQWYALPYVMERKFRLTTFKDDNDYSTLEEDAKANGSISLKENQTFSAFKNRYYIRFVTREAGKPRTFILVLDLIVGC